MNKKLKVCVAQLLLDDLTPKLMSGLVVHTYFTSYRTIIMQMGNVLSQVREDHCRVPLFYEEWIDNYLDTDFFRLFRLRRDTFQDLVYVIAPLRKRRIYQGGRAEVPIDKSVLVLLWYLGRLDPLLVIADRFNLTESCVHRIIGQIVEALIQLTTRYIFWPTTVERRVLMRKFRKICGFPGVIGAIDGTHIKCKIPKAQQDSYCDRKFDYSITVQGICDADRVLRNISVGWPGSIHDARIFRCSSFGRTLQANGRDWYFDEDNHILGDAAYPLRTYLLTPFRDTGRLTRVQRKFNTKLSQTRVTIEHCFGILKGRWRILQYINVYSVERAVQLITACCVLHNFCIYQNDLFEEELKRETHRKQPCEDTSAAGTAKRNLIASQL